MKTNAQISCGFGGTRATLRIWGLPAAMTAIVLLSGSAVAQRHRSSAKIANGRSDAALVKSLSGFENGYAQVNGTRLHYVVGGKGKPLVLLPGWPETWWEFH